MIELKTTSMEEETLENQKLEELEWTEVGNTKHGHYLIAAPSDPNSNLISVQCRDCSHGASYNPDDYQLVDGKLIKKGDK